MRTGSVPTARIGRAQEAATAMRNQLSKTIRFICGVGGTSVGATTCGSPCRSRNLSSPARRIAAGRSVPSGSRRRSQRGRSSLERGGPGCRRPRTCQCCACSRGTGRRSSARRRGSTWLATRRRGGLELRCGGWRCQRLRAMEG